MFSRMRDSIVYPAEILRYRNDKVILVLLYILFFGLLMATRTTIEVVQYDGVSSAYKNFFEENANVIDPSCAIENAILTCDTEERQLLIEEGNVSYYIDSYNEFDASYYSEAGNVVIINQSKVHASMFGFLVEYEMSEVFPESLQNIDFDVQTTDEDQFYTQLFDGLDELLLSNRNFWGSMLIVGEIITSLLLFMVFILISSWFMRVRYKEIPFRQVFVITSYSSTALFVVLIFNNLLNLNTILLILLIIIAFRQNNILTAEIERRLRKPPKKEDNNDNT